MNSGSFYASSSSKPTRVDRPRRLLALLLLIQVLTPTGRVAAAPGSPAPWQGKVIGVADGDTITVLRDKTPVKIRLHGVDAPEKAQPFGKESKQFTSNLVFGKEVTVRPVVIDKYGRTVAEIFVGGRRLNSELLKAGLAWHYKKYSTDKTLAALEDAARKARRGLWADPNPTPPWVYRHSLPLHGNVKSKVFHTAGCPDYNCKRCTARFKTVEAAVGAGYRAHVTCARRPSSTSQPATKGRRARATH